MPFYINLLWRKEGKSMTPNKDELNVEIKGYGCDDDCQEYFEKKTGERCGWWPTDNTCPLW